MNQVLELLADPDVLNCIRWLSSESLEGDQELKEQAALHLGLLIAREGSDLSVNGDWLASRLIEEPALPVGQDLSSLFGLGILSAWTNVDVQRLVLKQIDRILPALEEFAQREVDSPEFIRNAHRNSLREILGAEQVLKQAQFDPHNLAIAEELVRRSTAGGWGYFALAFLIQLCLEVDPKLLTRWLEVNAKNHCVALALPGAIQLALTDKDRALPSLRATGNPLLYLIGIAIFLDHPFASKPAALPQKLESLIQVGTPAGDVIWILADPLRRLGISAGHTARISKARADLYRLSQMQTQDRLSVKFEVQRSQHELDRAIQAKSDATEEFDASLKAISDSWPKGGLDEHHRRYLDSAFRAGGAVHARWRLAQLLDRSPDQLWLLQSNADWFFNVIKPKLMSTNATEEAPINSGAEFELQNALQEAAWSWVELCKIKGEDVGKRSAQALDKIVTPREDFLRAPFIWARQELKAQHLGVQLTAALIFALSLIRHAKGSNPPLEVSRLDLELQVNVDWWCCNVADMVWDHSKLCGLLIELIGRRSEALPVEQMLAAIQLPRQSPVVAANLLWRSPELLKGDFNLAVSALKKVTEIPLHSMAARREIQGVLVVADVAMATAVSAKSSAWLDGIEEAYRPLRNWPAGLIGGWDRVPRLVSKAFSGDKGAYDELLQFPTLENSKTLDSLTKHLEGPNNFAGTYNS